MSMILALQTLSDENIQRVLADPALIWRVLAPDDPEIYLEAVKNKRAGFLASLFGRKSDTEDVEIPALAYQEGEGVDIDLDKSWHGLHYLFTQSVWGGEAPLSFLLCGGETVGDIDVGYGPARVIGSELVGEIHQGLDSMDHAHLRSRFSPQDMMQQEIYPEIWDRDPEEDDTLAYCIEYFDVLKDFVAGAAKNRLGMVIYLS